MINPGSNYQEGTDPQEQAMAGLMMKKAEREADNVQAVTNLTDAKTEEVKHNVNVAKNAGVPTNENWMGRGWAKYWNWSQKQGKRFGPGIGKYLYRYTVGAGQRAGNLAKEQVAKYRSKYYKGK